MLLLFLLFIVFSNSITIRLDKSLSFNRVVIISLLYAFFCGLNSYHPVFFGKEGIGLFGGLLYIGTATLIFQLIIHILASIILIFTSFFPTSHPGEFEISNGYIDTSFNSMECNKNNHIDENKSTHNLDVITSHNEIIKSGNKDEQVKIEQNPILNFRSLTFNILEYPLIILFIINGALFLMSSSDLISIFICIELQSYGLYIISTIYKDSESSTSGGLMYFLLGGLSSCFILLGAALLYANSGTTNLDNLYIINDITNASSVFPLPASLEISGEKSLVESYTNNYIIISLIFITVGFLFKVSAAPFHFWSPDVYDSIPTVVTTFVAIIAKLSIFILLLEIINHFPEGASVPISSYSDNKDQYILNYYNNPLLSNNILLSSVLSLIIGTVLGLSQTRIKRLFAYSTISHIGFILLSLSINSVESIQAFFFYLAQYSFSNLNAFFLLVCIGYTYHYYKDKEYDDLKEKNNSPIQLIGQLKGYFYINPMLCISLAITLFSFTGIPPLIGFFGKMMVLSAAIDKGYIFMCLLAILTSVISAGYYLYIIKQLFFYKGTMIKDSKIKNPNYEIIKVNTQPTSKKDLVNKKLTTDTEHDSIKEIILSDYLTISTSVITLFMCLFIFTANESLNLTCILALTYI